MMSFYYFLCYGTLVFFCSCCSIAALLLHQVGAVIGFPVNVDTVPDWGAKPCDVSFEILIMPCCSRQTVACLSLGCVLVPL
jgi:hypothetical protein